MAVVGAAGTPPLARALRHTSAMSARGKPASTPMMCDTAAWTRARRRRACRRPMSASRGSMSVLHLLVSQLEKVAVTTSGRVAPR